MMPAPADVSAPTADFALDRARNAIVFTRELSGTPADAFAAWTDPAQVARWWDPTGEPLARCEIDLTVGGSFTFVGRNDPDRPFTGTYREIAPPHLLVFEAMGAEGRVALAGEGNRTLMKVEIICSSPEQLEQFVQMGVADGTSRTLDNLVARFAGGNP